MEIKDFSMEMFRIDGKNAIVTGGNSGLGMAFATALAKAGANLLRGKRQGVLFMMRFSRVVVRESRGY